MLDFSQTGSPVSKVLIALNTTGKKMGLNTPLSPTRCFFFGDFMASCPYAADAAVLLYRVVVTEIHPYFDTIRNSSTAQRSYARVERLEYC